MAQPEFLLNARVAARLFQTSTIRATHPEIRKVRYHSLAGMRIGSTSHRRTRAVSSSGSPPQPKRSRRFCAASDRKKPKSSMPSIAISPTYSRG